MRRSAAPTGPTATARCRSTPRRSARRAARRTAGVRHAASHATSSGPGCPPSNSGRRTRTRRPQLIGKCFRPRSRAVDPRSTRVIGFSRSHRSPIRWFVERARRSSARPVCPTAVCAYGRARMLRRNDDGTRAIIGSSVRQSLAALITSTGWPAPDRRPRTHGDRASRHQSASGGASSPTAAPPSAERR